MNIRHPFSRGLLAAAVTLTIPSLATAQQLEEVMVTATKRVQSTQDIPMSVEAVSGEMLANQGITNMEDLATIIPSFMVGNGASGNTISMRGQGTGANRAFEQSVAMFTDGVYMPRSRQYTIPFVDAERIEVLRGPQAVMFGLNATAGSISVISAKTMPGDELHGSIKGEYETEFGGFKTTAIAGGSVGDNLGLRLVYQNQSGDEGFLDNTISGEDEGAVDSDLIRLMGVWSLTDNLEISAKLEHGEWEQEGGYGELFGNSTAEALGDGDLDWKFQGYEDKAAQAAMDGQLSGNGSEATTDNAVINLDWQLGNSTLTAMYGYSDFEWYTAFDVDGTNSSEAGLPFPDYPANLVENYEQNSFEIRLASDQGDFLEYIVGAYYQDAEQEQKQNTIVKFLGDYQDISTLTLADIGTLYFPLPSRIAYDQDMWSVFGSLTFNIGERWRVIGGVRYVDDSRDYQILDANTGVGAIIGTGDPLGFAKVDYDAFSANETYDSSNTMPELVVQWDVSDDSMLFAKVGESAKSGGYATNGQKYDDETVLGFELGWKARLLDGAAELNVTLFRNEFDDLQVGSFAVDEETSTTISIVNNAGTAVSQGLEADGRWAVNDWLTLGGSVAFLDAYYDEFETGPCPGSGGTSPSTPNVDVPGSCDLSDESTPYSADISGNLTADVRFGITSGMDFDAGLVLSYSDDYFTEGSLVNETKQDSYTKVGARIGVVSPSDKWSVSLIGQNLTDEETLVTTQAFQGAFLGYLGAPRTITLQAVYNFGG